MAPPVEALVRRRRLVAAAAAVLAAVALAAGILVAAGGSGPPIATGAARLVPADALVYVHLSTDGDRDAVRDGERLGERFPAWEGLRDAVLARLAVAGTDEQVGAWLGDEMALALVGGDGDTAGSLVLLEVGDEARARAFVAEGARRSGPAKRYEGVTLARYGAVYAAFVGGYVALGQEETLRRAIDLDRGRDGAKALADDPTFAATSAGLPEDRVADAYATADGLRRLLVPAGGLLGIAGVVFDRPGLTGVAAALRVREPGAELVVRSRVPGRAAREFTPSLLDAVPKGAMAYYGTRGLDQNLMRLLASAGTEALDELLADARAALGDDGAAAVRADVLELLSRESALALLPGVPAPTLLVIARAEDPAATRAALARLTETLERVLEGARVIREDDVTRIVTGGAELDLAVVDDRLVVATSMRGIAAARDPDGGIGEAEAFRATVGDADAPVTSLVFLDFNQLLTLAEQTGLDDSRAYREVKADLHRLAAVGVRSTGAGEDPTSEIRFQIP
ncbi:MAG: DUF3352 domain-containing protein [Solirubrobacteraceae bacterium]|nr:DUF3352 domain-containing protein [Solirubrobacteraceae bacterium]